MCLLLPGDDGASLEKEARRWATRVARDCKNKAHSEEVGAVFLHSMAGEAQGGACPVRPVPPSSHHPADPWVPTQELQRLEAKRQQVPEAEVATVERRMEEARENIRKAEVGPPRQVALKSVTPGAGDAGMGRCGGWRCDAGDALPLWQPRWGPGATGLAGLSPQPLGVPKVLRMSLAPPGQPGEGRGTAGAAAGSRAGRGRLAGRGHGGSGQGGTGGAGSGRIR